jgi:hypothetical protein
MLLLDMDKKVDLREFISIESESKNLSFTEENESGPCRDRTDDPQIKSSSQQHHSMPEKPDLPTSSN